MTYRPHPPHRTPRAPAVPGRDRPGRWSLTGPALAVALSVAAVLVPAVPTLIPPAAATPAAAAPPAGIALGAYVAPAPVPGAPNAAIAALTSGIGRGLAIFQTFQDWETTAGVPQPFPTAFATYVSSVGATPMITWQPQATPPAGSSPASQPDFSLVQLASGRYDPYITGWADQARAFTKVVYVRLMHEMNGRWYPWGATVNGNTPQQYVAAWQHIVGIFVTEGATNVRFVWCASTGARNDPGPYFPGDAYVSWIALDGYNRWGPWRSFTSIFAARYAQITAISGAPVMIAETASVEDPLDPAAKSAWISSAFAQEIPQSFPRVAAALYFDAPVGAKDQVLTSSAGAMQAFGQVAALPRYQAPAPG